MAPYASNQRFSSSGSGAFYRCHAYCFVLAVHFVHLFILFGVPASPAFSVTADWPVILLVGSVNSVSPELDSLMLLVLLLPSRQIVNTYSVPSQFLGPTVCSTVIARFNAAFTPGVPAVSTVASSRTYLVVGLNTSTCCQLPLEAAMLSSAAVM